MDGEREVFYHCLECGGPIYEGDAYGPTAEGEAFRVERTFKLSDALKSREDMAAAGTFCPDMDDSLEEQREMIAQMHADLAENGDRPIRYTA